MITRGLAEGDLDALLQLYGHLHDVDDPLPNGDVVTTIWNGILQDPGLKYFGAFMDGCLVSSCNIALIANLTRGCRPYGLIENVVTHGSYRRRGLATAVLQAALDFAWSSSCYKVMLMTGRKDEGASRFYEAAGFIRNEKEAFIAKPAGRKTQT